MAISQQEIQKLSEMLHQDQPSSFQGGAEFIEQLPTQMRRLREAEINIPVAAGEELARIGTRAARAIGRSPLLTQALLGPIGEIPKVRRGAQQFLSQLDAPIVSRPGVSREIGRGAGDITAFGLGGEAAGALASVPEIASVLTGGERIARAIPGGRALVSPAARRAIGAGLFGSAVTHGAPLAGATAGVLTSLGLDVAPPAARIIAKGLTKEITRLGSGRLGSEILGRMRNMLERWRGDSSVENVDRDLYKAVERNYREVRDSVSSDYNALGNSLGDNTYVAKEASATIKNEIKENNKALSLFKKAKTKKSLLELVDEQKLTPERIASLLEEAKIEGKPEGAKIEGRNELIDKLKHQSELLKSFETGIGNMKNFEDATIMKKLIGATIDSNKPGDIFNPVLYRIKEAVRKSADETAQNAGGELQKLWHIVDNRFKNEVMPFRKLLTGEKSPFWRRFVKGGEATDKFVSDYIKPGKTKDQAQTIENLFKILPDEKSKDLAVYGYYKGTEDNPDELLRRHNKLGANQKALMHTPEERVKLEQYSRAHKLAPSLFKEKATTITKAARYAFPLGAGALGFAAGGPIGTAIGLLAPPTIDVGITGLTKIPAVREKILQSLLPEAARAIRPQRAISSLARSAIIGAQPQLLKKQNGRLTPEEVRRLSAELRGQQ